jgi:hypothetical protein
LIHLLRSENKDSLEELSDSRLIAQIAHYLKSVGEIEQSEVILTAEK